MHAGSVLERLRAALGARAAGREHALGFALDYARLLAQVLPEDPSPDAKKAMERALAARCDLGADEVAILLEVALAPDVRSVVAERELRAFGSRFGAAEEASLRAQIAEEPTLENFAERYGSAEALLLLDSLFAVCAVDSVIDRSEIGLLQRSATALGIDPVLVSALFRKHDARYASGDFRFELDQPRYLIGRGNDATLRLPDPQVAPRHAELVRERDGRWRVHDAGSGRPTLINGNPVSSAPLVPGDNLRIGPYTLVLDKSGQTLTAFGFSSFSSLSVRDLNRKIGKVSLLDDVGFTVFSGEVIAVVGPSGGGKTTLLNAIAGIAPADRGDVLLDNANFHTLLASDKSIVGIVPQDDVVHPELTVEESLYYSGRLRFPRDVGDPEIHAEVDRVLEELTINHIRGNRIGDALRRGVSGGQRKRVSLGQELLTRTTRVLFLDEPTSGLDPQTAQDIVGLVRQLADDGRIVFIVTHDVSPSVMSMVDHLLVLAPGGRVAWFGPPNEACAYFGVASADEIFARLPQKDPTAWKTAYRESSAWRKYVRTREHLLGLDGVEVQRGRRLAGAGQSRVLQYMTLTRRYIKTKLRDRGGLMVLLAQAPILALAMRVVFPVPDHAMMFVLVLSALWFGASGSVRELISDRTIWRREARVGLRPVPYVASKVSVLGGLVFVQCGMLAMLIWGSFGLWGYGVNPAAIVGVATGTGLVGMALGLMLSALFNSSEGAVGTLPLVLIPQITFGGLIVKLKEMDPAAWSVAHATITRYAYEAAIKTAENLDGPIVYGKRKNLTVDGVLFDIGMRTNDAYDHGLPILGICGVLFGFAAVFLVVATLATARAREGS